MNNYDIIRHRLIHQQIAETTFTKPTEIVGWMGAMQSQLFAMAKWAIGLRVPGLTDADVEQAFNEGKILRTHLLRPTWHFVTPADIRWLLDLTGPRVHAVNAFMYRKMELDTFVFNKSTDILINKLEGGKHLTRPVLKAALEHKNIVADGIRLSCIMMYAELEGIICSGPRDGKQFTYALLEERVPPVKKIDREEALLKLTTRYFTSRGPATIQDYTTWSGLTVKDAKEGIAALDKKFEKKNVEGKEYIFIPVEKTFTKQSQTTFLMPDYDEYGMGYKDRSASEDPMDKEREARKSLFDYSHMLVVNGQIRGTWEAIIKNKRAAISTTLFTTITKTKEDEVKAAVQRYLNFAGNASGE